MPPILRGWTALVAAAGAALLLLCCLLVRGGLLDATRYGDVHLYGTYGGKMAAGLWPYGDFFDEYPPLAQPLFLAARWMPGSYATGFKWAMAVFGAATVVLLVATLAARGASRRHGKSVV